MALTPPARTDAYHANFETLRRACNNGDLALMSAIRKSDQEPVALVCAMYQDSGGMFCFSPLAVMCEGNPFEDFEDPTQEDEE